MSHTLHLKDEYYRVLKNDPKMIDWLNEDVLNGILYCDFDDLQAFWISDSFWKTLSYPIPEASHILQAWKNSITPTCLIQTQDLLTAVKSDPSKVFEANFEYRDFYNDLITLKGKGFTIINEHGDPKGIIIKYRKIEGEGKNGNDLSYKIKGLHTLNQVYEETNELARVGGWEVDMVLGLVTWTKLTKDIHEVEQHYEPKLTEGINFYKEGESRDLINKLFTNAIEKNIPFDSEFKIITAKGREIWVRSFGKPEFKDGKCIRVYGAFQDIDAQKKRELELKKTKERFEKIFSNSSIGMLLVNTQNKLLMVNDAAINIFGFAESDKETVMLLTYKDMVHPDDLEEANILRAKLLAGEVKRYKMESRFITAKGKTIWCNVNTSIVYSEDGSDDLIITQVEDITDLKNLERISKENSDKFINAFENSPNGMGVVTINGDWLMVNKNLSKMIGYSKKELLSLNFKDITHPDDLMNDSHFLLDLVNNKRDSYNIQKRYIHKKGHIVYGYLNASSLRDEKGTITSLIGQVVDITEQKKAERALKGSLNNLQSLMNATTQVSIIESDLDGVIRKFNKGAENLLGYKASEAVGILNVNALHDLDEIGEKGKELSEEYNQEISGFDVFVHKAKLRGFDSGEWTKIRKDGSRFPVQLVVTAFKNTSNKTTGYLGVAIDISELKEMEESLVKSKLKAEAANKSKSEFLANMSHEIRTPLNGVIGFTDLLMRTNLTKNQTRYMQTVYSSANTLLDLVNDILDFSKIEAGKLELNEEKTNLTELCSQTIDIIKHQAHSKGLEVLLNISSTSNKFLYVDSVRLRQILTNLLGNAVKFTENGEIELKVDTNFNPDDPSEMIYKFSIRDTGIGIAPHNLKKIFYAFDQEDASTTRKYGGTGLGLTISNKLLHLMGSELKVESKIDVGSIFYFTVSFKTEHIQHVVSSGPKRIKKVLVVDDNENNRTILKEMLAVDGINTTLLSNGIETIELLKKGNDFDLAIIDYHMPYLNGLDLIRHLREKLGLNASKLPIVLLHSSGEDVLINKGAKDLDLYCNTVKPIQIKKLYDLITEIQAPGTHKIIEEDNRETVDLSEMKFNIMIAEDNPVNKLLSRTIVNKILPKSNIIEVDNGLEAVELYDSAKVDLIFMDIQMPVLSGYEATEQIRLKEGNGEKTPIIALTARIVKGEMDRCKEHGMDDYITKPVVLETIKGVILDYLVKPKLKK